MSKRERQSLSGELAAFVREQVGPISHCRFCGWDHGESSVWRVQSERGIKVYLKTYRQPRTYHQELRAYLEWAPALTPFAPRLLAARNRAPSAIIVTEARGELVENLRLAEADEREVYRQAGSHIRKLHDLPFEDRDRVPLSEAYLMRLESWRPRFAPLVTRADADWVGSRLQEVLPDLSAYRRVPTHRDYTGRNWLWDAERRVSVIDFAHARPDLRLIEFERLWVGVWPERPDLREAFFEGYGAVLSAKDEAMLERCAALGALTTIAWAHEHADAAFEAEGRSVLARLKRRAET